jgi:tRNA(His) 5'-end guanylyltransferase
MPVILRLDGKAFHTFTSGMNKPFDRHLIYFMQETTKYLLENIQNAVLGYTQSDEISILLMNYNKFDTESWFDNNLQKMVSVSAAMASSFFTYKYNKADEHDMDKQYVTSPKFIQFDSRAFVLPEAEVNNYFISRQNDCQRNSIQMVAQSLYSHKSLQKLSCPQLIEKIERDENITKKYDNYSFVEQNGSVFLKYGNPAEWNLLEHIFRKDSAIVNQLLIPEE